MKIRNLKEYIKSVAHVDTIEQIGLRNDPLLTVLTGENTDLEYYIENLTNFAVDSSTQVFYELLQNADDAGGTVFYAFFDEENLLFVNNAKPFKTNSKQEEGQLKTFLVKNKSDKKEKEGYKGKHGQGSKLLYDFLTDSKINTVSNESKKGRLLYKSLVDDLNGPILFSWNDWSEIERINFSEADYKHTDHEDESISLLTKIIYSYYPSMPLEEIKLLDGVSKQVFTKEDLHNFKTYFQKVFSIEDNIKLKNNLSRGTAIYIKLGTGQYERLLKSYENGLKPGIATSLVFLKDNFKDVRINGKHITKVDYQAKELNSYYNSDEGKFKLAYPKDFSKELTKTANFFQYFPITKETRGFNFVINSNSLSIPQSRQEIDLTDDHNVGVIENIGKQLQLFLESLKPHRSEFNNLYASFLRSDEQSTLNTPYHDLIYNPIIESLKSNIPLIGESNYSDDRSSVIIKNTELPIALQEFGINKEFVDVNLSIYLSEELASILNMQTWDINRILVEANRFGKEQLREWIENTDEETYDMLLDEFVIEDINQVSEIPFVRFSNGKVYSIKEINSYENVLVLDNRTKGLKRIFEKIGLIYGGEEILNDEKFNSYRECFSDVSIFTKINNSLKDYKLAGNEKRELLKILFNEFDEDLEELIATELELFENIKNEKKPLSKLLFNSREIASSGILDEYQIKESEIHNPEEYANLFMDEKTELLPQLVNDWNDIIVDSDQKYKRNVGILYEDLNSIIANSEQVTRDSSNYEEQKIYLSKKNDWQKRPEIFCTQYLRECDFDAYDRTSRLIEKISNFSVISFNDIQLLDEFDFLKIPNKKIKDLSLSLKSETFKVNESELVLLILLA